MKEIKSKIYCNNCGSLWVNNDINIDGKKSKYRKKCKICGIKLNKYQNTIYQER